MAAVPNGSRPARLRTRLLSLVYETLILAALLLIATAAFTAIVGDSRAQPERTLLQLYLLTISAAYCIWSWTGGRRTLPMRTWRMRLVDTTGEAPRVRTALVRYLAALAGYSLGGISIWWALVDREHAFLHDRLARTRLVLDPSPPAPSGDGSAAFDGPHEAERKQQEGERR